MTICGSGQYLQQVEQALYRNFHSWKIDRIVENETEEQAFQYFLKDVYKVRKGTSIMRILSTMVSPDLEGNAAHWLLRHQQECSESKIPRENKSIEEIPRMKRDVAIISPGISIESLCPLPGWKPIITHDSTEYPLQDWNGDTWDCAAECKNDPLCSYWLHNGDNCYLYRNKERVLSSQFQANNPTTFFFGTKTCQAETTSCPEGLDHDSLVHFKEEP